MRLKALAAVVATLLGVDSVRADYLPQIVFPPTASSPPTFTPGESFSFVLQAPPVIGFFSYDVTLQLQVPSSAGDLLTSQSVSVTQPTTGYAFGMSPTDNFVVIDRTVPGSGAVTFEITDSSGSSIVATPPGQNNLAQVMVNTSVSLDQSISISVKLNSYSYNNPFGNDGPGFMAPPSVTVNPTGPSAPAPVPTPGAWLTFGCGGLGVVAFRNRFGRKTA